MNNHNGTILQVPTPQQAKTLRARAILDAAKHCPFCGGTDLLVSEWILDDGEVDAIECNCCGAGAPAIAWSHRSQTT